MRLDIKTLTDYVNTAVTVYMGNMDPEHASILTSKLTTLSEHVSESVGKIKLSKEFRHDGKGEDLLNFKSLMQADGKPTAGSVASYCEY
jgi:hypothetical protein